MMGTSMLRHLVLGLSALASGAGAHAADPAPAAPPAAAAPSADMAARTKTAARLVEVMQLDRQLESLMPQLVGLMMGSLVQGNTGKEAQIRQILTEEINAAFRAEQPAMMALYRDLYARNLTLAELEGMIAFYSSDVGRSVLGKMPTLTQEGMQGGAAIGQKAAQAAIPRVIERMQAASLEVPKGT